MSFNYTLKVGFVRDGLVAVTVDWDNSRLSITGTVGLRRNGDAAMAGQIVDSLREVATETGRAYLPLETVQRLADVWERWHLNDMRAGCEHQRAEKWEERPIDPSKPTNTYGTHYEGQRYPTWNMLTWVTRAEHPEGLLSEPCPTCGYRYGSSWLREEVPADVLDFLRGLAP